MTPSKQHTDGICQACRPDFAPSKHEQEVIERLDKIISMRDLCCGGDECIDDDHISVLKRFQSFLLQEIRSAVERRDGEIVEIIEKKMEENAHIDNYCDTAIEIKNLITNKK